jgi:sugar O-acyltransferase (sialic acid O-acetyltransferase NeuD family)
MKVLVYGAGGHGRVVADALLGSDQYELAGFLDDDQNLYDSIVMGLRVMGGEDWLRHEKTESKALVALGIGDNVVRQKLAERCKSWGVEIITAVHPSATVSRSANVRQGTVVMAGAVINPGAEIGRGVIVNTGAVVEHDVVIGDYAHVSPNSAMGGAARLGALSHLGIGAAVLPGVGIGSRSVIGAGAVVTVEIPNDVIAVGVPASVRRRLDSI